jgi:hypothetical protein
MCPDTLWNKPVPVWQKLLQKWTQSGYCLIRALLQEMSCDRPTRHKASWFSSVLKWMERRFARFMLLLDACRFEFIKIKPLVLKAAKLSFQIMHYTITQKINIPPHMFPATIPHNSNIFTSTLLLSGLADEPGSHLTKWCSSPTPPPSPTK